MQKLSMIAILLGGLLMAGFGATIVMNSGASSYMEDKTAALQEQSGVEIDWKDNRTVGVILLVGGVICFISAFFLKKMLFVVAAVLILAGAAPLLEDWHAVTVTFPVILAGVGILILKNKLL